VIRTLGGGKRSAELPASICTCVCVIVYACEYASRINSECAKLTPVAAIHANGAIHTHISEYGEPYMPTYPRVERHTCLHTCIWGVPCNVATAVAASCPHMTEYRPRARKSSLRHTYICDTFLHSNMRVPCGVVAGPRSSVYDPAQQANLYRRPRMCAIQSCYFMNLVRNRKS
jgi:hypothetical protein